MAGLEGANVIGLPGMVASLLAREWRDQFYFTSNNPPMPLLPDVDNDPPFADGSRDIVYTATLLDSVGAAKVWVLTNASFVAWLVPFTPGTVVERPWDLASEMVLTDEDGNEYTWQLSKPLLFMTIADAAMKAHERDTYPDHVVAAIRALTDSPSAQEAWQQLLDVYQPDALWWGTPSPYLILYIRKEVTHDHSASLH